VSARERAKALVEKIVAEYVALETRAEGLEGRAETAERALAESKEREQALRRKFAEMADSGANKALRARVVELEAELVEARRQLAAVHAGVENVWRWQGDGADRPESLACPVVMTADTLRGLAARVERAERTVRLTTAALMGFDEPMPTARFLHELRVVAKAMRERAERAEMYQSAGQRMLAAFDRESGDLMGLSKEFYEAEAELRKVFGPPKEGT